MQVQCYTKACGIGWIGSGLLIYVNLTFAPVDECFSLFDRGILYIKSFFDKSVDNDKKIMYIVYVQ